MDIKALFKLHAKTVQANVLRKTRDPQLAADLTQESFVRLIEQPHNRQPSNPVAWLQRTAHNLMIDHLRQQARRQTDLVTIEELDKVDESRPGVEQQVTFQQQVEHLQMTLGSLPTLTQRIFILNRIEGMTHAEVAQQLNISDSSVQKHLSRALAHILRQSCNNASDEQQP